MDSSPQPPVSHEDLGPQLLGLIIFFIVVTSIIVPLRFYARYLARAGFWWDDWILLGAYILVTMSNCTRWWFVKNGLGQHIEYVDPSKFEGLFKALWTDMFLYGFAITAVKLGVIAFYFRTFKGNVLRTLLWISTAIIILICIGSTFLVLFQCNPVEKFWAPEKPGTCIEFVDYIITQAVPNIFTDFIVLSLPLPSLYNLVVSPGKRGALLCIFIVGYFVTCVSIARTVIIVRINPKNHPDFTWNFREPNLWSAVEQNIALITACFPPLAVLVREAKSKVGTLTNGTQQSGSNTGRSNSGYQKKWFSDVDSQKDIVDELRKEGGSIHSDNVPLNTVRIKQEYRVEQLPKDYV